MLLFVVIINKVPESADEAARIFKLKRQMVEAYVIRVDVAADKAPLVTYDLNFG